MRRRIHEKQRVSGRVRARQVVSVNGRPLTDSAESRAWLRERGIDPESAFNNLVVNVGRYKLARLLGGASGAYVNRIQLGDTKVAGVVSKSTYPADLSDTGLVHEITNLSGEGAATFDLDATSYPGSVVKVNSGPGTPGTLTAGVVSTLTDAGADFASAGVIVSDTVTVELDGEDYTFGIKAVVSPTELEVYNPGQVAGAVNYTVETPGTQVLFSKLVSGDNFPVAEFGVKTTVHEAGLLFTDGALFNRVVFAADDDDVGLVLRPTDIDGVRIDVQLDWLITF